jgi:hypothetical protein
MVGGVFPRRCQDYVGPFLTTNRSRWLDLLDPARRSLREGGQRARLSGQLVVFGKIETLAI